MIFHVFQTSWRIFTGNFVLAYPFLMFLLLMSMVVPQNAGPPALNVNWITLGILMVLLYYVFMAGIFGMIAQSITVDGNQQKEMTQPEHPGAEDPQQLNLLPGSFGLFKAFFPTIGQHFVQFAVGGFIQVLVLVGLAAWVKLTVEQSIGIPPVLTDLFEKVLAGETQVDAQALLLAMPEAQKAQLDALTSLFLVAGFGYSVFFFMTMAWPAWVVAGGQSALGAHWASFVQCFKDPVTMLGIVGFYLMTNLVMMLVLQTGNPVVLAFAQLAAILFKILLMVMLMVYVAALVKGQPLAVEGASSGESGSGPKASGQDTHLYRP